MISTAAFWNLQKHFSISPPKTRWKIKFTTGEIPEKLWIIWNSSILTGVPLYLETPSTKNYIATKRFFRPIRYKTGKRKWTGNKLIFQLHPVPCQVSDGEVSVDEYFRIKKHENSSGLQVWDLTYWLRLFFLLERRVFLYFNIETPPLCSGLQLTNYFSLIITQPYKWAALVTCDQWNRKRKYP